MLMGLLKISEDDYRNEIIWFNNWCVENYLDLNVGKTKKMVFDFKKVETNIVLIILKNGSVEIVNKYKYLGIYIDNRLNFSVNIENLFKRSTIRLQHL